MNNRHALILSVTIRRELMGTFKRQLDNNDDVYTLVSASFQNLVDTKEKICAPTLIVC